MSPAVPEQVERFRAGVERRFGLAFDDSKLSLLRELLERRAAARGCRTADEYLRRYLEPGTSDEMLALAEGLTIGETYFFRNQDQFRALAEVVLPARIAARQGERALRVLSAGCASGEEPYSLAMALARIPALANWRLDIRGIDLNPVALEKATSGRYSSWSLRETPEEMRTRFFRDLGRRGFALDEAIRRMVVFEQRNLFEEDLDFWRPGYFDVVFCRNVLMYFSPPAALAVVDRIARSLAAGGFLFLGHAETLRGLSAAFHLRHSHRTFYYEVRDPRDASAPGDSPLDLAAPETLPAASALGEDASWLETIQRASRRIEDLSRGFPGTERSSPSVLPSTAAAGPSPEVAAGPAVAAMPTAAIVEGRGADAQLFRAILLIDRGDAERAEATCRQILRHDELNAGAHYVLALCREHAGDIAAARTHDQYALYLDPGFAMSRLHLGLMARRAGDNEGARRELSQALMLLAREDAPRILLLGNGFSREDLLALCRAQLRACGGAP